jgi:hypothetical protein
MSAKLKGRKTPHTDAWVAHFRASMLARGYGSQSALARYLCGDPDAKFAQITRWVSTFSRWFRRTALPSMEDAAMIDAWLRTNPAPDKPPQKKKPEKLVGR